MNDIIVAVISSGGALAVGICTLIGVIITNNRTIREMQHKLDICQAVTETKIDELTREVRLHNDFARRVPVVEEQIKAFAHRMSRLENLTQ